MSRLIATGRGQIHVRATVEGWPVEFVTAVSMAQTMGDGRERAAGLQLAGITIGANLDLPSGKIDSKGSRVEVHGVTRDFAAVASLRKKPTLRTYLTSYIDRTATTIPVFSTDGWPTSGVLHLNTEAISYTGVTSTTFTGCTRGVWDTVAQAHFVQDGGGAFEAESAGLAYPPVTNHPASLEGRRVFFHLYSAADGHGGDGNLRWFGVAVTDARFEGLKASFQVDPPTAILKQQIGGDVTRELPIRGIYYPWSCPFVLPLTLCDSAGNGESEPGLAPVLVRLTGHYETEADFCDALTTEIASAVSAWGGTWTGTIYAQPTSSGFELVYSTPATGTRYVRIRPDAGGAAERAYSLLLSGGAGDSFDLLVSAEWLGDGETTPADPLANDATYRVQFSTSFPRAYFGDLDTPWTRAGLDLPAESANAPGTRIYLGGLIALSTDTVLYEADRDDFDPLILAPVGFWDTGDRWVQYSDGTARFGSFTLYGPATRFKAGRQLARGNVGDLLTYLVASSPDYANVGAMPLLRDTDVDVSAADISDSIGGALVEGRRFVAMGQDVTLEELVAPEIAAAGMHWTIGTTGVLGVRRVRLASSTDPASYTITARQTVGTLPTLEASALWGFISALHLFTGYDPIADEYTGTDHFVPNVQGSAPNRAAKTFKIEPKSIETVAPTESDVVRLARVWLGLLGLPYDIVTLQVPMLFFDAQLGDAIKVTSDHVLNDDGTMGIEDKLGILIGYEWELETGRGGFTLLMHRRNIAGYAPGFRITSQTDNGGDEWKVVPNLTEVTDQSLTEWYEVGDEVEVLQQDSTAPTTVVGTVVSVSTVDVTVQFAATWTPGSDEWAIEPRTSNHHDQSANLARFVYVAADTARITYADGTAEAKVLS